jgi:hypothetical protein
MDMRRSIPILLATVIGIWMFVDFYLALPPSLAIIGSTLKGWIGTLVAGGFIVGGVSLTVQYGKVITNREPQTWYALIVLGAMIVTIISGMPGLESSYDWINNNIRDPLELASYAMVLFFITSAAFRSFRARSIDTTLMVVAAFFVFLLNAPASAAISPWLEIPGQWIYDVIVIGVRRATTISTYLGIFYLWLRTTVGFEKRSLGVES